VAVSFVRSSLTVRKSLMNYTSVSSSTNSALLTNTRPQSSSAKKLRVRPNALLASTPVYKKLTLSLIKKTLKSVILKSYKTSRPSYSPRPKPSSAWPAMAGSSLTSPAVMPKLNSLRRLSVDTSPKRNLNPPSVTPRLSHPNCSLSPTPRKSLR
jgi:hypothetical protein